MGSHELEKFLNTKDHHHSRKASPCRIKTYLTYAFYRGLSYEVYKSIKNWPLRGENNFKMGIEVNKEFSNVYQKQ